MEGKNKLSSLDCLLCSNLRYLCDFLVLPEVELPQTEAGSSIRNPYRPVHKRHLLLLHGTSQPSLPANHKLT